MYFNAESTVGEIVNLMSVDTQKFVEVMPFVGMVWSSPIQIAISIYMLYNTLGGAVFAGLGILLLLIPINGFVATLSRKYQMEQMKLKDQRIKLTNEVLSGIKVLKLYAWEPSYEHQIDEIRKQEIVLLRKAAFLNCSTVFSFQCAPFLVSSFFSWFYHSDIKINLLNFHFYFYCLSRLRLPHLPRTSYLIRQTSSMQRKPLLLSVFSILFGCQ